MQTNNFSNWKKKERPILQGMYMFLSVMHFCLVADSQTLPLFFGQSRQLNGHTIFSPKRTDDYLVTRYEE